MNILPEDKPLVHLYCEARRLPAAGENQGKGHIKIVLTFIERVNGHRKHSQKHYKTGIFCRQEDFPKIIDWEDNRYGTDIIDTRARIRPLKARAELIAAKHHTPRDFETHFLSGYAVDAIAPYFEEKIGELKRANKISSAEKYRTTLNVLQEYFGADVTFDQLTAEALQGYEDWYITQDRFKTNPVRRRKEPVTPRKKSLTTVGINMRNLRHIFKRVTKRGIIPSILYPFGIDGYVIPEGGDDTKQFLESHERNIFLEWRHADDKLNELHDYALFSYFAFGINLADVARLRKVNVFKTYISIDRQKTKGRKKKMKKHTIPMHPKMQEIIRRRGIMLSVGDHYIFPILNDQMTEEQKFYRVRDLVDRVNAVLAMIAREHNFEIKPTSYTLRHTFSFFAMEMGATTEQLQDMLAHGNSKTTESYKHGFALEIKKKFSDGLG